ncbi:MAG: type II secretion system secretin GspD [Rhodocyclaceae bacterium]|nr:type II secretion system secretin GspD [Rhodocyclaceae bacterium]
MTHRTASASRRPLPVVLALIGAAVLTGCAGPQPRDDRISEYLEQTRQSTAINPPASGAVSTPEEALAQSGEPRAQPLIFQNSGNSVHLPGAKKGKSVEQTGEGVRLEFSDAPLAEVVQALLGDLLGMNYTVDQMPEVNVSLRSGGDIDRSGVLPLVESLLASHGAVLIQDEKSKVWHVTTREAARLQAEGLYRPNALPPGYGVVVVPLHYVSAREMADILRPIAPDGAILRIDNTRNLLMLAGTRGQHETWMEIIRAFDVDALKGMSLGIFPLEYASAADVHETLMAMISSRSETAAPAAAIVTDGQPEGNAAAAEVSDSTLPVFTTGMRLIPISRINSLVFISPHPEQLASVREWIARLDQPVINDLESRLYVYPVQNGSALHLAELLRGLYAEDQSSSERTPWLGNSGVAPGLNAGMLSGSMMGAEQPSLASALGIGNTGNQSGMMSMPGMMDAQRGQAAFPQSSQVQLDSQVRIVADDRNNALLIRAPRKDYRKIEAALRKLDVAPAQVLIEAAIVEVQLTGKLKYGLEWAFKGHVGSSHSGVGMLNMNTSGDIGAAQPGFSWTVSNSAGSISAVLNALASDSLLRVLSSPSLLVQDNYTASIHVGDQQPVQSGSSTNLSGEVVSTNIEYRDTGVMLAVTPSVNAGGQVTMNLLQTVTDVGAIDEATGQRSFLQRQVKSRVAVRSGETVVMGGLIRDRSSNGTSGLPILSSIPFVGGLFGTTSTDSQSTELLVLITPRVIAGDADLRAVSEEMKQRMRQFQTLPAPREDAQDGQ